VRFIDEMIPQRVWAALSSCAMDEVVDGSF
jgi:hypothetical protein